MHTPKILWEYLQPSPVCRPQTIKYHLFFGIKNCMCSCTFYLQQTQFEIKVNLLLHWKFISTILLAKLGHCKMRNFLKLKVNEQSTFFRLSNTILYFLAMSIRLLTIGTSIILPQTITMLMNGNPYRRSYRFHQRWNRA